MSFSKTVNLGKTERPNYRLIKAISDNIEIRKYPTKNLDSNNCKNNECSSLSENNFFSKLLDYVKENGTREKIEDLKNNVHLESLIKTNEELITSTDRSLNESKESLKDKEIIVAVIKFNGDTTTKNFVYHRDILIKALGDEAKNYDKVNIITTHFDRSYKYANEVWLRKIN